MAFVVSAGSSNKEFPLMAEGVMQQVVLTIEDLGMQPIGPEFIAKARVEAQKRGQDPNKVKTEQRKARLRYTNAAGESVIESFSASIHPLSRLHPRLLQILGREPGKSFDLDTLNGMQLQILVSHVTKGDKKYANIAGITKPLPGQKVPLPEVKGVGTVTATNPITEQDIPF
jgi:hypothetical protein